MKTCTVCKKLKPTSSFRKYSGRSSDGRRPLCKTCQRAYEKEWRVKNVKRLAETRKKRLPAAAEYRANYNAAHRGEILVQEAIRRAKRKGLPCDLHQTGSDIIQRVNAGICELTGLPLNMRNSKIKWDSPSLDRIRPSLGYTAKNIRVICFALNSAFGSWGEAVAQKVVMSWLNRKTT